MKLLEERICKDGIVLPGGVLKVDSFLNHQIDTQLMYECGAEWYEKFKDSGVTKIVTIEASGIGLACLTAYHFHVPVVFAKKMRGSTIDNSLYSTKVVSYTHGQEYDVIISKKHISPDDKILIVDDLLANGSAMKALITLCNKGGATVVGCGAAIEKLYQGGGNSIRNMGYKVESLAKISSISDDGNIEFC